jgi:hypothetical protein
VHRDTRPQRPLSVLVPRDSEPDASEFCDNLICAISRPETAPDAVCGAAGRFATVFAQFRAPRLVRIPVCRTAGRVATVFAQFRAPQRANERRRGPSRPRGPAAPPDPAQRRTAVRLGGVTASSRPFVGGAPKGAPPDDGECIRHSLRGMRPASGNASGIGECIRHSLRGMPRGADVHRDTRPQRPLSVLVARDSEPDASEFCDNLICAVSRPAPPRSERRA